MMLTTINASASLCACAESNEDRLAISPVVAPGHFSNILSQARETGIRQERGTFPVQTSDGIDDRKRVKGIPLGGDWVIFESAERGGFRFRITFLLLGVVQSQGICGQPGIDKVRIDLAEILIISA
jgi:hypothetical protein